MATDGVSSSQSSSSAQNRRTSDGVSDALRNVDIDQFLKLMISELQNQDPLNPTDNQQILEQINTLHQIASSDKLGETLDAVLLGQNLVSAGNLIGREVRALDDRGKEFTGKVDRVTVTDGAPKIHSGNQSAVLNNIREILPGSAET